MEKPNEKNIMPKVFTSKTQKIGELGEKLAARYLEGKGFSIIERNYTKKWGEIDIIAKKAGKIHFVEVKAQTLHGNATESSFRPEDNMHGLKIQRLLRTMQTYLLEKKVRGDWQFDLLIVSMNPDAQTAKVRRMDNLIL